MQPEDQHEMPDAQGEPPMEKSHSGGLPLRFGLDLFKGFDPSAVTVEPVEPVDRDFGPFGGRCLLLRNVLSPEECALLIREMGAEMEPVRYRQDYRCNDRCIFESPGLAQLLWSRIQPVAERLVLCVDPDPCRQRLLAEGSEQGLQELASCPDELRVGYGREGVWRPVGLNECLRFCRYTPGGFFRAHCDACFERSEDEQSLFTCMFYLDGGMEGGATRFMRIDGCLTQENYLKLAADDQVLASVAPEPGLCILFFQPGLLHEGEDTRGGVKHILRTDVMYRRDPATKPQRTPEQVRAMECLRQAEAAEIAGEYDRAAGLYRRAFKLDPALERMC